MSILAEPPITIFISVFEPPPVIDTLLRDEDAPDYIPFSVAQSRLLFHPGL
jgi:hypothetical protein